LFCWSTEAIDWQDPERGTRADYMAKGVAGRGTTPSEAVNQHVIRYERDRDGDGGDAGRVERGAEDGNGGDADRWSRGRRTGWRGRVERGAEGRG
jgi:hypothetical protein